MKTSKPAPEKHFKTAPNTEMNSATAEKLRKASRIDSSEVYAMLDSSEDGITPEAAKERISKFGLNEVDYDRAPAWYVQLLNHLSIHLFSFFYPSLLFPI